MFDRRASLIALSIGGGLLLGAALWFAFGRGAEPAARLDDVQSRLEALQTPQRSGWARVDGAGLAANPVFAMTTGPNAVAEPTITVQGLARTPGGASALLAINGKAPDWLTVGDTRDGVTLDEVRSGGVLVDTVTGQREIALGQKTGPAPQAAMPGAPLSSAQAPAAGGAPAGYRLPPPPANAPTGR